MLKYDEKNILKEIEQSMVNGYLSHDDKVAISKKLKVPISTVESVASFYDFDEKTPKICNGLSCSLRRKELAGIDTDHAVKVSCLGYCDHGPVLYINGKYMQAKAGKLYEIPESRMEYINEKREKIEDYINAGGYSILTAGNNIGFDSVITSIEKTDLRGMGGAGFPVKLKWLSFQKERVDDSYLLVNAHEGEPGTFKDRVSLELQPHRLLDGILIASRANSIKKVIIALRWEYKNAMQSLNMATDELTALATTKGVELPTIEIVQVRGSYVTGEETALMEAIEGRRSEPRLRPPFPTERGLYGKPTLVHNVETLSVLADIVNGATDTIMKKYCVTGDVKNPGVYSEKIGTVGNDILSIAGSSPEKIKAFLPGGLSGGIIKSGNISEHLDFISIRKTGASFGTGAFIAISGERCIVDVVKTISEFFSRESCGKCMPCRYGSSYIHETMKKITSGKGNERDVESAKEVARAMMDGSICALGVAAGKVFLDLASNFSEDVKEHLEGRCSANICFRGEE